MVVKLLTLAMVVLLVSCGAPADGGSSGSGGKDGKEVKEDSAELVGLKKVLEDDYEIYIMLNISVDTYKQYTEILKKELDVKTGQVFTSDDINCKSFNFRKISDGINGNLHILTYKNKVESQSNECQEADFSKSPIGKGDKNYILMGKKK